MRNLINTLIAILMSLLIQSGYVSAEPAIGTLLPHAFPGSGGLARPMMGNDLPPAYPEWPERAVRSEIIPPPPGGPYMSSALSGIDAFPAETGGLRNENIEQQEHSLFFKVDMPWPETAERERPQLWTPESGEYKFVPEDIVRQLETPATMQRQEHRIHQPYLRRYPPPPVRQPYYGYY